MGRIKDRLILGGIAGLIGNIAKNVVVCYPIARRGVSCPERASVLFVPNRKVNTPLGTTVGWLADAVMSTILGAANVYMLSITGKNRAVIKGAGFGAASWLLLVGYLPSSASTGWVRKVTPANNLYTLASNMVHGATTSLIASWLGDESLFNGEKPLVPLPAAQNSRYINKEDRVQSEAPQHSS